MANFSLQDVLAEIDTQANAAGLNPRMAQSIVIAENTGSGAVPRRTDLTNYSGDAVSPKGASGLMQVMPQTALGLQKAGFLPADWKHDPSNLRSQVQAGIAAMKEMTGRMSNPDDLGELGAMYNGGTNAHKNYKAGLFDQLPQETRQYNEKLRRANMELGGQSNTSPSTGPRSSSVSNGTSVTNGEATRTTTRSTSYDPAALQAFTDDILSYAGTGGTLDQTTATIANNLDVRQQQTQQLVEAITAQGSAASDAATGKAMLMAAGDAKRAAILASMNLNPAATNNEMSKAFDAVNATDAQLLPMKQEIDARMAVGFFDNPLEWLINQTRLPGMVQQYNGIVGTQKDAISRFKELSSMANSQQTITAATDADLTRKAGIGIANVAVAEAQANALKVGVDSLGADTRDALTLAQLTGQKAELSYKQLMLTKQGDSETVSISESASEREGRSESDRAKRDAKQAEEVYFANINRMVVAAGGEPYPNMAQIKMQTGKKKDFLLSAATSSTFGPNFSESFGFVWDAGNREKMAATGGAATVAWIQGTARDAGLAVSANAASAAKMRTKYDGAKELPVELDKLQTKYEGEAVLDMSKASANNPFKIDYASIAKSPALAKNPMAIWLKEYGPKGSNSMMTKVDEELVIKKFAETVTNGAPVGEVARAINEFYRVGAMETALSTKWALFGLSKPEKTYQVQLRDIGPGITKLDLGDPAQVENAITRKVVFERIKSSHMGLLASDKDMAKFYMGAPK